MRSRSGAEHNSRISEESKNKTQCSLNVFWVYFLFFSVLINSCFCLKRLTINYMYLNLPEVNHVTPAKYLHLFL